MGIVIDRFNWPWMTAGNSDDLMTVHDVLCKYRRNPKRREEVVRVLVQIFSDNMLAPIFGIPSLALQFVSKLTKYRSFIPVMQLKPGMMFKVGSINLVKQEKVYFPLRQPFLGQDLQPQECRNFKLPLIF